MAVTDTARGHSTAYSARLSVTVAIAGLALLAAALHLVTPFNHDEAWFLQGAQQLLDGGRLGKDIIDNNPPPVWWMSKAPVWLARQIGAPIEMTATLFTVLLAVFSLVTVDRLIDPQSPTGLARHALLPIAAILLLFVPGYDFGQREHWAVILALPYVIARSRRAEGERISTSAGIVIGIAACFGFCLKFYLLLVPIALEIWLLARTRRISVCFSPETIALGITGLVFVAFTVIYTPTYFGREIPTALLAYWTLRGTLPQLLQTAVMALTPIAALVLLGYSTRRRADAIPAPAQALAVAGAASLVAALLQKTPWAYHFLPSVVFFGLSALVLLVTGTPKSGARSIRIGALAVLVAIGLAPSAVDAVQSRQGAGTKSRVEQLAAVFRANAGPNRIVSGFVTSPRDVLPAALASGMKWAVPFCCDYLIAAAVRADEAPASKRHAIWAAALDQADMAVAAVRAKEPGVIVIDAGDHMLGFKDRKFDYIQWLEARTDFADILRHYREISPVGPFRLFVRM